MSFGKGLLPSTPSRIAHRLGAHLHDPIAAALAAGPRGRATLEPCRRLDQGNTSTCHAHSAAAACWTAFKAAGKELPFVPSPLLIASTTYANRRSAQSPVGPLPPLSDDGAELQEDSDAMSMWGIAPIQAPAADGRYSDVPSGASPFPEPDATRLQIGGIALISGEYAIAVDGNAPRMVAASLDAGVPVWVGFMVDGAFENLGTSAIAQAPSAANPLGGHAVYLSAYRTNSGGRFEYLIQNSWGANWAENGAGWASEAWLMATWDLWPFAVAA